VPDRCGAMIGVDSSTPLITTQINNMTITINNNQSLNQLNAIFQQQIHFKQQATWLD
jgi:hypothetical protein